MHFLGNRYIQSMSLPALVLARAMRLPNYKMFYIRFDYESPCLTALFLVSSKDSSLLRYFDTTNLLGF